MYFAGDEHNARDPMAILMGDAFARNVGVETMPSLADVSRAFRFDIVVGGRNATFFA
jgi:protocatechuate 3,4-dioxygenase beta subunit